MMKDTRLFFGGQNVDATAPGTCEYLSGRALGQRADAVMAKAVLFARNMDKAFFPLAFQVESSFHGSNPKSSVGLLQDGIDGALGQ